MGQRLVVTVKQNDKEIAGIYYHWSAYTISALDTARRLIECLTDSENPIQDLRLRLIRFVEQEGGCIDHFDGGDKPYMDEWNAIKEMYPNETFNDEGSRSDGLIALTESGIEKLHEWEESSLTIDLDEGKIFNDVYSADTMEDYKTYNEDDDEEEIPTLDITIEEIPFDKISETIDTLENLPGYAFMQKTTSYEDDADCWVYQLIG